MRLKNNRDDQRSQDISHENIRVVKFEGNKNPKNWGDKQWNEVIAAVFKD